MFVFFGTLFQTSEDYFVFQLKDSKIVLNYINNRIEESELQHLQPNDIFDGKLCLCESENNYKRSILKKLNDSNNFVCEFLDDYGTTFTSIDKIYQLPQQLASIEPQLLKCKLNGDVSSDFLNQLTMYNSSGSNESLNGIVKIQVDRVDKNRCYYLKSISVIYASSGLSGKNATSNSSLLSYSSENDSINISNVSENFDESKNFGFDFDYPEVSKTKIKTIPVSALPVVKPKNTTSTMKSLTKEQINKTKLQLTKKFTHEAKYRPFGVLVIDLSGCQSKKLSIPKCIHIETATDHYVRSIAKLRLCMDSHFSQLLSFEKIISGRDVSLVGPVKSGLSTACALGLSFKMHTQLTSGQLPTNKLHAIILIRNAASGRYLEKFFTTIFKTNNPKSATLKILFIDEISTHGTKSSANVITANIIIGSVRCILEAISQQFIVLNDLKCVLIDDAHVVLRHSASECQLLFNQIKQAEDQSNLWNMLTHRQESGQNPTTPTPTPVDHSCKNGVAIRPNVQIIANSHKWTLQLKLFQEAFLTNPLLYIIDPIEMVSYLLPSPYMPQLVFHSNTTLLKSHFLTWIQTHITQSNLLVFTRTALECEMVYDMCNSNGINTLRGTGFVDPGKIHDLNTVWCATRDSTLRYVFVVSDCALSKVTISDAIYTYHYTLPYTKADLRNRLGCSLSFYQSIVNNTNNCINLADGNQFVSVCPSYDCSNFLYCYKHLTANCDKSSIGAAINNFYKSKFYTKEYELCDQLCPNIKLYGVCPVDKVFCKHSHLPWIINLNDHIIHRGSVTFTVSSVRCCTQLFGIVEQFSTGNLHLDKQLNETVEKNRIQLLNDLSFDMQLDSEKEKIKFNPNLLKDNCVYTCKDQAGAYYRCKLMDICVENNQLLNVYCVDTGLNKIVNKNDVFKLPEAFKSLKPLVYEFIFTDFIPVDVIYGWPNHLNIQISEMLIGKTVNAHIHYGFDNIIWIDSLVQKSKLKNIQGNVVNFSMKHFLKNSDCSQPTEQLKKYVNQLDYSTYQYEHKSSGHYKNLIGSTVDVCGVESLQQATVCELSSTHFHVNHCDKNTIKENIENQISDVLVEAQSESQHSLQHYRINDLCLAKFPDNLWYRARVTHFNESSVECTYNVYMIDIGEVCKGLTLNQLKPISKSHPLTTIPGLAVRCTIVDADFSSLDGDQLDAVFDYFDQLYDNLFVQYMCKGLHTKIDPCVELTHNLQCYYSVDDNRFCNVLLDLFLDYHVMPSDSMNEMLYNHFNKENKNGIDSTKFTREEWVEFVEKVKSDVSVLEQLKSLLNRRLIHSNSTTNIDNNDDEKNNKVEDTTTEIKNESNSTIEEKADFIIQIKLRPPKCIKWFETTDGYIKIRVTTNEPSDICVDIDQSYFTLKFNDSFNGCDIGLNLFDQVKPETKHVKITSCCLYITVEKQTISEWSNFFASRAKFYWLIYDFDNVTTDEEVSTQLKSNKDQVDWTAVLPNNEIKKKKNSSVEFRLPEDDDYFQPTSSELSELEGFHSDVDDHENIC